MPPVTWTRQTGRHPAKKPVAKADPADVEAIYARLSGEYGESLTTTALAAVLGIGRREHAATWAIENRVRCVTVGGRRRWLTRSVARTLAKGDGEP